jgi:hypothetical protein
VDHTIAAMPFAVAMFVGMLIFLELGRLLGIRNLAKNPQGDPPGIGKMEGSIFGLYSLLLAFTFSGAPARFDAQRHLIVDEANAIGTAYLRLDLLPQESQPELRERFRKYLDSRLEIYRKLPDIEAAKAELAKSGKIQQEIWTKTLAAARLPGAHPYALNLVVPAVNAMIDITAARTLAARLHPPHIIFWLLFLLALVCSLLAGYGMAGRKQRSWMHITAFVVITVITVYVVLEIEYPRMGFVRHDAYDQVLVELGRSMQ